MRGNANEFFILVVGVTTPGTAEQVTAYQVPDGLPVTVTARRSNTGTMYIADSQANAQATGNRKALIPGQSLELFIDNTNRIWRDADNSTDRLEITVQQIPSTV